MNMACRIFIQHIAPHRTGDIWGTHLVQLPFGLPYGGHGMVVAALQLAGDAGGAIPGPLGGIGGGSGGLGRGWKVWRGHDASAQLRLSM
jgi:hypothetical protein